MVPFPTLPLNVRNFVVWLSCHHPRAEYTDMVWASREKEQDERNEERRERCRYICKPAARRIS